MHYKYSEDQSVNQGQANGIINLAEATKDVAIANQNIADALKGIKKALEEIAASIMVS